MLSSAHHRQVASIESMCVGARCSPSDWLHKTLCLLCRKTDGGSKSPLALDRELASIRTTLNPTCTSVFHIYRRVFLSASRYGSELYGRQLRLGFFVAKQRTTLLGQPFVLFLRQNRQVCESRCYRSHLVIFVNLQHSISQTGAVAWNHIDVLPRAIFGLVLRPLRTLPKVTKPSSWTKVQARTLRTRAFPG